MKTKLYQPKNDAAAEFSFAPSKSIKKLYPDAETEILQMDLQAGEIMSINPSKVILSDESCILDIKEGTVTLMEFADNWEEISSPPAEAIIWDAERMISTWSFDD